MDLPTTFAEAASSWDYDRLVCSHYNCDWEHEYDTTTMAPDSTRK